MAKQSSIELFLGEDKNLDFTILNLAETLVVDITGWTLSFMVKRAASDLDSAALLTMTTASQIVIAGTWNENQTLNAQKATVSVASTDTDPLSAGTMQYELKRTNNGVETVLAYGPFTLKRGVHRT